MATVNTDTNNCPFTIEEIERVLSTRDTSSLEKILALMNIQSVYSSDVALKLLFTMIGRARKYRYFHVQDVKSGRNYYIRDDWAFDAEITSVSQSSIIDTVFGVFRMMCHDGIPHNDFDVSLRAVNCADLIKHDRK